MKIGLGLPQDGSGRPGVTEVAVAAERAGIESLWAYDRVLWPVSPRTPYPASADGSLPEMMQRAADPLLALTAAAAVTSTIRLGSSVLVAPWYPPLLLARAAASLDRLSDGRFSLGLGVGWSVDEYEAVGVPMAGRGRRLDEVLDVLGAAWADDVVSITTSREHVAPSVIGLKPAGGRVPVLLAAFTPDGFERVARRADGWVPAGIPVAAATGMWAGIRARATELGRDASAMRLVVLAHVTLTDSLGDGRPEFVGSLAQVRDDVRRCLDAGVDELVVNPTTPVASADEFVGLVASLTEPAVAAR